MADRKPTFEGGTTPSHSRSAASLRTQSFVDGELVEDIVEKLVEHTFQNSQLLKYRLLQSVGVTLLPVEQQSLVAGEEKNPQRRAIFSEEKAMLRDAVMMHFYPTKRSQLTHVTGASPMGSSHTLKDTIALAAGTATAMNASVAGLNPLQRLQKASLSDIVREQIDVFFQQAYEETSLRLLAHHAEVEEHIGPNRRLNKAIGLQREKIHTVMNENASLTKAVAALEQTIKEKNDSYERKELYHKQQLNNFLKEIAILKEQLYRTYRDKNYVGRDVDLMLTIVDDDTCEDVNVDQLLHYRRTMRGVEQQIAVYKNKIKALEEDVESREQAMQMFQEKQRSREISVANAQKELDDMNAICIRLEGEKEDLLKVVKNLQGEIHTLKTLKPETRETAIQATDEEDQAKTQSYLNMEVNVAMVEEKREAMKMFDKVCTERNNLKTQVAELEEKARKERAILEARCKDLEQRALYAEKRQDDLRTISTNAISRQQIAEAHAAEVANAAAGQTTTLSKELKIAQDEVETLRGQNATLCLAYTGMWERLQAIKTKAGLTDYKRRSNEHHFMRAEAAISEANKRIEDVEKKCSEEIRSAEERVQLAEHNLSFALEDVRCLKRKHMSDLEKVNQRIQTVEEASRALLEDYNRLRTEHLRVTADTAMTVDAEVDLIRTAAERLGSASSSSTKHRSSIRRSDDGTRQVFAFEALTDPSLTTATLSTKLTAVMEGISSRREAAAEPMEFTGRKIRPAQLPNMVAKELEHALITLLYPLVDTLAKSVEADAALAQRAVAADAVAKKKKKQNSADDELPPCTVEEYTKWITQDDDAELQAMGLGEQREAVAWMKLRSFCDIEQQLRACLQRLHKAGQTTKLVPLDLSPLPAQAQASVVEIVSAIAAAHPTKHQQHAMPSTSPVVTPTTAAGHNTRQSHQQQQPRAFPKKPLQHSLSSAADQLLLDTTEPLGLVRPGTSTPSHSHGTDYSRASTPSMCVADMSPVAQHMAVDGHDVHTLSSLQQEAGDTTVVHQMPKTAVCDVGTPMGSKQKSIVGTPSSSSKTKGGPAPVDKKKSSKPLSGMEMSVLSAIDDASILALDEEKPLPSRSPHTRPSSTGTGSPRSRRALQGRWAGLPSKTMVLPSLQAQHTPSTVASECSRLGPAAMSDALIHSDESLAGVPAPTVRGEGDVESDTAFGNALSINKEYTALRERLDRALAAKGIVGGNVPPPTAPQHASRASVLSSSTGGPAGGVEEPSWKKFKMSQRKQQ